MPFYLDLSNLKKGNQALSEITMDDLNEIAISLCNARFFIRRDNSETLVSILDSYTHDDESGRFLLSQELIRIAKQNKERGISNTYEVLNIRRLTQEDIALLKAAIYRYVKYGDPGAEVFFHKEEIETYLDLPSNLSFEEAKAEFIESAKRLSGTFLKLFPPDPNMNRRFHIVPIIQDYGFSSRQQFILRPANEFIWCFTKWEGLHQFADHSVYPKDIGLRELFSWSEYDYFRDYGKFLSVLEKEKIKNFSRYWGKDDWF